MANEQENSRSATGNLPATPAPTLLTSEGSKPTPEGAPETRILAADNSSTVELPSIQTISGYVIERELGRGGMGVVYQARQLAANRSVALKMILSGAHAGAREKTRFRAEAEAVARLQHPHIVQIFDVGEHDGLPFFSLEFCAGGGLEKKLSGTPLPANEAAALVEKLARAMDHAHQNGVVHRDLKPANVLLDANGEPKIGDFGLAKLDEVGQTQSGAVMGTPSYMAPEQATGRTKELGPSCDVYALGAILYECLTGRPPFRAATIPDTLLQVLNEEPVQPARLNPQVPRDLETVCLKCLEKDSRNRYASARELAEDLRRFQRSEPIMARPVGRLERAVKWGRRNPAVAGLLAVVVFALLAGASVSFSFAVAESRRADEALQNEEEAVAARKDYERANTELKGSRAKLETALARSLLAPMSATGGPWTELEREALVGLADSRSERVGLTFVREAIRTPLNSRQLRHRARYALHAALGLDLAKRREVEQMLIGRLQDPKLEEAQRIDLSDVAISLGGLTRESAGLVASAFTSAVGNTSGFFLLPEMGSGLADMTNRLEPKQATQVANALMQTMARTTQSYHLRNLASGVGAVADHAEPREAARVCALAADTLSQAMVKTISREDLPYLASGLAVVAARAEPKEAARACARAADPLSRALAKTTDPAAVHELARHLGAVAERMEPTAGAKVLSQALANVTRQQTLSDLALRLAAVAGRMEPNEAARVCARAADTLSRTMARTTEPALLGYLASGLAALAAHLEPEDITRAAGTLAQARARTPYAMPELVLALQGVAARMDPGEAAQLSSTFSQALTTTKNRYTLATLAETVAGVATGMEPQAAAEMLSQVLSRTTSPNALGPLASGLAAVRLEPKEAARVCARAIEPLSQAMTTTTDPQSLGNLAAGLAALSARLEPKKADAVRSRAAATLAQAMTRTTDYYALTALARHLLAMSNHLEAKMAVLAASALSQGMASTTQPTQLRQLASELAAVVAGLEAKEAARACAPAAETLSQAIAKATASEPLRHLALGLAVVAVRLEREEAVRACTLVAVTLFPATARTLDAAVPDFAFGMAAVVGRLEPKEADRVCVRTAETLIEVMSRTNRPNHYLAAVLKKGNPVQEVVRVASAFDSGSPFSALTVTALATQPPDSRLSTQQLIELLKLPLCVGQARRVILDQLGTRYARPFGDQWEFARFVEEEKLDLDLTSPPKRLTRVGDTEP